MVKYWAEYVDVVNSTEKITKVGYRTLAGFMTDIIDALYNNDTQLHHVVVYETHKQEEAVTLLHPPGLKK